MFNIYGVYGSLPPEVFPFSAEFAQLSPVFPADSTIPFEALDNTSMASIIVRAPAATLERRYTLALALQKLQPDGKLIVAAPKDKGGQRISKELEEFGCTVRSESRHHWRICHTTRPHTLLDTCEGAIAQGGLQYVPATGYYSQPGVFSWNQLDEGSAVLLDHLPRLHGVGADLGCGIGVLSKAILKHSTVSALYAVDVDARALRALSKNISDTRLIPAWHDLWRQPFPHPPLDFVVMNPPFHDHGKEDKSLGQMFIMRASHALKSGGVSWLVANQHLPYEEVLKESFASHTIIAVQQGFKIIRAIK